MKINCLGGLFASRNNRSTGRIEKQKKPTWKDRSINSLKSRFARGLCQIFRGRKNKGNAPEEKIELTEMPARKINSPKLPKPKFASFRNQYSPLESSLSLRRKDPEPPVKLLSKTDIGSQTIDTSDKMRSELAQEKVFLMPDDSVRTYTCSRVMEVASVKIDGHIYPLANVALTNSQNLLTMAKKISKLKAGTKEIKSQQLLLKMRELRGKYNALNKEVTKKRMEKYANKARLLLTPAVKDNTTGALNRMIQENIIRSLDVLEWELNQYQSPQNLKLLSRKLDAIMHKVESTDVKNIILMQTHNPKQLADQIAEEAEGCHLSSKEAREKFQNLCMEQLSKGLCPPEHMKFAVACSLAKAIEITEKEANVKKSQISQKVLLQHEDHYIRLDITTSVQGENSQKAESKNCLKIKFDSLPQLVTQENGEFRMNWDMVDVLR